MRSASEPTGALGIFARSSVSTLGVGLPKCRQPRLQSGRALTLGARGTPVFIAWREVGSESVVDGTRHCSPRSAPQTTISPLALVVPQSAGRLRGVVRRMVEENSPSAICWSVRGASSSVGASPVGGAARPGDAAPSASTTHTASTRPNRSTCNSRLPRGTGVYRARRA